MMSEQSSMRTIILAAGLGTRLRPLTDTMPKALVPVGGKTLLQHTLDTLISQGATEAIVNIHHFGQQIIDFLHNNPQAIPVHISDERNELLNTGGGIRKAIQILEATLHKEECDNSPVLVHNVDIFSNADLADFYKCNKQFPATLLVSPRPSTRQLIVRKGRLVGWKNLTTGETKGSVEGEQYAFSGIHMISPLLVRTTMDSWPPSFSIMDYYLSVCADYDIHIDVQPNLRLLDVGKTASLAEAQQMLRTLSPDRNPQ